MSFIAGAITSGTRLASTVPETISSAMTSASFAMVLAVAGKRLKGEGRHEARGLRRHQDAHLGIGFGQQPDALDRLVGGDPATDRQCDPASLQPTPAHTGVCRRALSPASMSRISRARSSISPSLTPCPEY